MNSDIKDILQILSASLAPVTAIIALGIAYRQHRLETIKFRHQLYERRLAIFTSNYVVAFDYISKGRRQFGRFVQIPKRNESKLFSPWKGDC